MSPNLVLPPLAAYVHIPWCLQKCPYCDFNSHGVRGPIPEQAYITAVLGDLAQDLAWVQGRPLSSIFFGGGTPSLFSPQALGEILHALEQQVGFVADIEITLEANPGTFEQTRFQDYRALGINRLSIGIQSFQEAKLKALGRVHNGQEAIRAIEMAHKAGFDNFNLDLMHGLPGQSLEDALSDLTLALQQQPTHLSWYQLTLEPNTQFWHQPPLLPEDDLLWAIQEAGQDLLAAQGYQHYETSAYSRPDKQARHNLNYWQFGDFLGLGAGAHAKLTHTQGQIIRHWKHRHPKDYLAAKGQWIAGEHTLEADELPFEFLMNALRLTQGVPSELFSQRTGLSLEQIATIRRQAEQKGLLETDPQHLVATAQGQLFLNDLLQLFLP